jgi:hypothetical protein
MPPRKPLLVAALAALALLPGLAGSQDGGEKTPDQMMALMKKWSATDEHHKELAWYLGTWDTEMRMTGAPAAEKGTSEFKWIVDGRWIAEDFNGTLMGAPYHGYGVMGFDRFKKKWVSTWVSSADTAMLRFEGVVVDPTGKVKVLWCNLDEYLTGERDRPAKGVYRKIDENTFLYELWDMAMGLEGGKVLEITYKRRK